MKTLFRIARVLRDTWLVIGMTVLLFFLFEFGLSLSFHAKDRLFGVIAKPRDRRVVADTYSDSSWVNNFYKEFRRSHVADWRPYVYWRRRAFSGDYINIDTDGIRLTTAPGPKEQESSNPAKIFMFGGSTMWGTGARDAFTIPSILARDLQDKGMACEITNFGEQGYVSTQEVISLMLLLQKNQIPDLVIFYDGLNDTYSAYQQHVAGIPQNEFDRAREFNLSQPAGLKEREKMVLRDVAERLPTQRLFRTLRRRLGFSNEKEEGADPVLIDTVPFDSDSLAHDVINRYKNNVELVSALSENYHFKYFFYWQPTAFDKTNLTPYEYAQREADVPRAVERFFHDTYEIMRQSRIVENTSGRFHDLSSVFSDIKVPVYIDWMHLGEAGNGVIARKMADDVVGAINVGRRAAKTRPASDRESDGLHNQR